VHQGQIYLGFATSYRVRLHEVTGSREASSRAGSTTGTNLTGIKGFLCQIEAVQRTVTQVVSESTMTLFVHASLNRPADYIINERTVFLSLDTDRGLVLCLLMFWRTLLNVQGLGHLSSSVRPCVRLLCFYPCGAGPTPTSDHACQQRPLLPCDSIDGYACFFFTTTSPLLASFSS